VTIVGPLVTRNQCSRIVGDCATDVIYNNIHFLMKIDDHRLSVPNNIRPPGGPPNVLEYLHYRPNTRSTRYFTLVFLSQCYADAAPPTTTQNIIFWLIGHRCACSLALILAGPLHGKMYGERHQTEASRLFACCEYVFSSTVQISMGLRCMLMFTTHE